MAINKSCSRAMLNSIISFNYFINKFKKKFQNENLQLRMIDENCKNGRNNSRWDLTFKECHDLILRLY